MVAGFKLENNANDYTGNHNCTIGGSPFTTVRKKYGLYSGSGKNSASNYLEFADSLSTELATCSAMTITFWGYFPSTKSETILDRRRNTANVAVAFQADGPNLKVQFQFQTGTWEVVFLDASYFDRWIRVNIEWTGAAANLYLDGVLKKSFAIALNPFDFGAASDVFYFLKGGVSGVTGGYYDDLVFTDQAEGGIEVKIPLTISSVYPPRGNTLGGRNIEIIGDSFFGSPTVDFDGIFATNVLVVSQTEITCTTPAHIAGLSDISINNSDGSTGTLADCFEYYLLLSAQTNLRQNSLFLNGNDITKKQPTRLFLNEELNIIESWDFNFSGIESILPLKFFKYLSTHTENIIEVKNENDILIYIGKIFKKSIDEQEKIFNLESVPFIDTMSTSVQTYAQTVAENGIIILRNLLQEFLPSYYSITNAIRIKSFYNDIEIYLDTDTNEENVMGLALSICELLQIGIYFDKTNIKLFPVLSFPEIATAIDAHITEGQKPIIDELPDLYFNKLKFIYKNDKAADEETITVGTGEVVKEYTVGNSIYMTDSVAAIIADMELTNGMKKWNSFSCGIKRNSPFNLADYFVYTSIVGTFLGVITKKEYEENNIKITGIGEWL